MGHQESVVTTTDSRDFPKLLQRVNQLGRDYYSGLGCEIGYLVTTKKNMRTAHYNSIPAGQQFLYVYGDRTGQRCEEHFLDLYKPDRIGEHGKEHGWDGEHIKLDFDTWIIFIEWLPKNFLAWGEPTNKKPVIETAYVKVELFEFDKLKEKD